MTETTKKALKLTSDNFRQFSRNGRWGTCGDCPRDTLEHAYPEFCKNTTRGDHLLNANQLAENYNIQLEK